MQDKDTTSSATDKDDTSFKEAPLLMIKGFLMGSADIVPGVSGGTMALIVGIYSRLIHAIRSFDGLFIKRLFSLRFKDALSEVHWRFMAILLAGICCALLFFTRVVPLQVYMFTDPELIYGLFFGLIVGSIFILVKELEAFGWKHAVFLLAGTLLGFWLVTLVPAETSESPFFVFISGSVAICAMILPGISGSYILLILRKYDFILSELAKLGTVATLDGVIVLLPFVLGAVAGLALFSRILSWLLDHYYAFTLATLIGFLIGSLYVIWPYQERSYAEFVSKTEVVEYNGQRAKVLREHPPNKNRPEFQRLGEVINPNASFDELKQIEVETVKQKMVSSKPYIPYVTVQGPKTNAFWMGIVGIGAGLFLVIILDFLRT